MAAGTKTALAEALKKMMCVKPIDKITVKDLVEICGVNRQTFYYHFDDIYDLLYWIFEEDSNKVLPKTVVTDNWEEDIIRYMKHLSDNASYVLNVYNSNRRLQFLQYIKDKAKIYATEYAQKSSAAANVGRQDFDYVVDFCADAVVALTSRWLDKGLVMPDNVDEQRFLKLVNNCVEDMLMRFEN